MEVEDQCWHVYIDDAQSTAIANLLICVSSIVICIQCRERNRLLDYLYLSQCSHILARVVRFLGLSVTTLINLRCGGQKT